MHYLKGWLFDSSRDYFQQVEYFKARKGGKNLLLKAVALDSLSKGC